MPDATVGASRRELRQAVRSQLETVEPGLRLVAEDLLADVSAVDWLGVDASGRAVVVLIADEGDDLATFTRALSARAWAAPRVRDWAQLAPALRFDPEAGVRALLVCESFDPDTTSAAVTLGAGGVELALHKPLAGDFGEPGEIELLAAQPLRAARGNRPESDAPVFRTGLSEADLGLSPAEQKDFD